MANPAVIPFTPRRLPDGKGYQLTLQPAVEDFPLENDVAAAAFMNKVIENEIQQATDQYMWLHRRFKTRPAGAPRLYE